MGDLVKKFLQPFSLFLFLFSQNYVLYNYLLMPSIYNEYGHNGYQTLIWGILITTILIMLIPKIAFKRDNSYKINKSIFKYPLILYLILVIILVFTISLRIITKLYFPTQNIYFFVITMGYAIYVFSKLGKDSIINAPTILLLIPIPIIIFSYFYSQSKDFMNLLPFNVIYPTSMKTILFFIFIIIDNFVILLLDHKKTFPSKIVFFSATILFLLFLIVENIMIVGIIGEKYFANYEFLGFLLFSLQTISRYVGNFEFINLYFVVLLCILKCSLYISIIIGFIPAPKKVLTRRLFVLLLIIIVSIILTFYEKLYQFIDIYIFVMIILVVIYYGWLMIGGYREKKRQRISNSIRKK